jgi:hypothetical protein
MSEMLELDIKHPPVLLLTQSGAVPSMAYFVLAIVSFQALLRQGARVVDSFAYQKSLKKLCS